MNDSDNTLDLLTMRGKTGLPQRRAAQPDAATDEDQCRAFGYLRGLADHARSLELRFADGNRESYPYTWLGPAKFNPSAGILLKFVGDLVYVVFIEGANLNALVNNSISLYDRGILRHRITWVREMSRQEVEKTDQGEVTVERIRAVSYRPDDEPKDVEWLKSFESR